MDNKKIEKMVRELETLKFFGLLNRLPNDFYKLTDDEKAEVIRRYRQRNNLSAGRPFDETK